MLHRIVIVDKLLEHSNVPGRRARLATTIRSIRFGDEAVEHPEAVLLHGRATRQEIGAPLQQSLPMLIYSLQLVVGNARLHVEGDDE